MVVAGLFVGHFVGNAIDPALAPVGTVIGALVFFALSLVEVFNIARKEIIADRRKKTEGQESNQSEPMVRSPAELLAKALEGEEGSDLSELDN